MAGVSSGKAFAILDRLLDEARTGPYHLRQPAIADMLVQVIHHNADVLGRYTLHVFVVMPNNIHLLLNLHIPLPLLTKALKPGRQNLGVTRTFRNAHLSPSTRRSRWRKAKPFHFRNQFLFGTSLSLQD